MSVPSLRRIPVFWRGQLLFFLALTFFGLVSRTLIHENEAIALAHVLVMEPAAVILTVLLRRFYRRTGEIHRLDLRTLVTAVFLCAGAALVEIGLAAALRTLLGWPVPDGRILRWTILPFGYYWIVFVAWSLLYFWMTAVIAAHQDRARALAAEAATVRSELDRLRLQLDPHLIFNALNGIAVEIPERPAVALRMLRDLSGYLRFSLQNANQPIGSVADEVALVRIFLAIQESRFGDRLQCRLDVAPDALGRQLPSFVVQLLVENAIKHGLRGGDRLLVTVTIEAAGTRVIVIVRNDGNLLRGGTTASGPGLGLVNLTSRLELHYPGRHRFTLDQVGPQVVAKLEVEGAACFG